MQGVSRLGPYTAHFNIYIEAAFLADLYSNSCSRLQTQLPGEHVPPVPPTGSATAFVPESVLNLKCVYILTIV